MIEEFDFLFNDCSQAFNSINSWKTGRELAYGQLNCMGRHTITGMLTASGQQFIDWSAAYRLFSKQRVDISRIFDVARTGVLQELDAEQMIVAHMDDTILKKTGRHVHGTAWRRDPLGPPFQTNFIWGQRFIQVSMALPDHLGCCQSRAIPIDFHHCPTPKKPRKTDGDQDWKIYKEQQKKYKLSKQGSERLLKLRIALDKEGMGKKQLIVGVDGSYTNAEVLKNLPERTTLIGRIRKDTKLFAIPETQNKNGRKRVYGEKLPTPEQVRQSEDYSWQKVKAWAAGKVHEFNVKVVKNTLWRSAGEKHLLQMVVIRPLGYRLTKSSKILYREPAYLICTDNDMDIEKLLQAYLWRWEIEVNFREEKTILGCGQAQVRIPESSESVPAFVTSIYSLLHLAAYKSFKTANQKLLPRPKWYPKKEGQRHTTGDLINNFKAQAWAKTIDLNFSSFVETELKTQSLRNITNPFISAMAYMRN